MRAWELYEQGWRQSHIADALGVSDGAVSQWIKRAREGGKESLRHRTSTGRPPKLTAEQRAAIPDLLARGAEAFGFRGDVRTAPRVAVVIEAEFGVRYNPDHITRLLKQIGWSPQQPVVRPTQRNEEAVQKWLTERWPELKKAKAERRTIVWVDESGFYLLPAKVRSYATRGQTPILAVPLSRDHLSAISGITLQGCLILQVQKEALDSEDVVRFLRALLRHIAGKLLIIWDGSPIHRSQIIKDFLADVAAERIHLEQLPGYAPDLNPDEGIWRYLKRVELRNVCCRNLDRLYRELRSAVLRLVGKRHIIRSCIRQAGCTL